jgi:hypothetical protein
MYEKYYLEEGKTSKCMVLKIHNCNLFEREIVRELRDNKIGCYISSDGYVHARVGKGKNSHKAQVCKNLGFKYIDSNYWVDLKMYSIVTKL